jgi:hypothetical protein
MTTTDLRLTPGNAAMKFAPANGLRFFARHAARRQIRGLPVPLVGGVNY